MFAVKKPKGGIHPEYFKEISENRAIEQADIPDIVYIPLLQHLGASCTAAVEVGQEVFIGTRIGEPQAKGFSAPVHSSVAGKVKAIERFYHPLAGSVETVIIENNKSERKDPSIAELANPLDLSPEEIIDKVKQAGIVGMGGAGFPTYVKLTPPKKVCHIDTLLINGAECEPYLTCDYRLMIERAEQIIKGVKLLQKALSVSNVFIGIEDNKPKAIAAMQELCEGSEEIEVVSLPSQYPQGGEKTLIKTILGREVPSGKLPLDVGVVVQNVATANAVYEALYLGKPLYERALTVTGQGIANPKNLLVRIGTTIGSLIQSCGGFSHDVTKIVAGGPMMGVTQYTDEIPVIKTMSGLLLMNKKQTRPLKRTACIRCGRCVEVCPQSLVPSMIANSADKDLFDVSKDYNIADCVECGSCAYICPAKIPLVHLIKYAKRNLRMRYEKT